MIEIAGLEQRILTDGVDSRMECLRPLAVYQTLRGPVDSMGVYFRCKAQGELLTRGDETTQMQWISIPELAVRLAEDPEQFSWVDRAGMAFYLDFR